MAWIDKIILGVNFDLDNYQSCEMWLDSRKKISGSQVQIKFSEIMLAS